MILDTIYGYMFPECKKQDDKMSGSGSTGDGNIFGVAMTNLTTNGTYTTTSTIYPTATQMYNAQNAYGAIGLSSQYQNAVNNTGGQYYAQAGANIPYSQPVPTPTGALVNIAFADATGLVHYFAVDAAHAQLIQEISWHNKNTHCPKPHLVMLDGDFSEDEMTEAEQIISEMSDKSGDKAARL